MSNTRSWLAVVVLIIFTSSIGVLLAVLTSSGDLRPPPPPSWIAALPAHSVSGMTIARERGQGDVSRVYDRFDDVTSTEALLRWQNGTLALFASARGMGPPDEAPTVIMDAPGAKISRCVVIVNGQRTEFNCGGQGCLTLTVEQVAQWAASDTMEMRVTTEGDFEMKVGQEHRDAMRQFLWALNPASYR